MPYNITSLLYRKLPSRMEDIQKPQAALATANRILAHEGVLDAFGHVSVRLPSKPDRFYLARSVAPELVIESDILEFDLDAKPVVQTGVALYSERVIHSVLYRMRPDIHAVCHHHSPAIMPFCLTDRKLGVVTQLGAVLGSRVPVWDQRDEFGTTNHLVTNDAQAESLARCLGSGSIVLMKRHGATVVGRNLREVVFRSIYGCRDAQLQGAAHLHGEIDTFTDDEIELAGQFPESTLTRAWQYWKARLPLPETLSSR
jgi:ribulose-5-phosphate 4-epimerase/fuculose-1-phosphate aldolase